MKTSITILKQLTTTLTTIMMSMMIAAAILISGCGKKTTDPSGEPADPQGNLADIEQLIASAGEPREKVVDVDLDTVGKCCESEEQRDTTVWRCETYSLKDGFESELYPLFDPNAEVIWPGSLLQGGTIDNAPPERIIARRGQGKIVINNLNGSQVSSADVNEVTLSNCFAAANEVLASQPQSFPARFSFDYRQIRAKAELAMLLEANSSFFGFFSMKSRFELEENSDKTIFMVTLRQSFYTLMFERPATVGEFFHPSVSSDELGKSLGQGNPPVYVSSVTYGRVFYLLIESSDSFEKMKAAIAASFLGTGINADTKYVKDLKNLRVQAFALGGDAARTLELVTDPLTQSLRDFVKSLSEAGDILNAVPLSYSVRSVKSDRLVKNADATTYDLKNCYPRMIRKTVLTNSLFTGNMWPTPKPGCGCAFETHKPLVKIAVALSKQGNSVLEGTVSMNIKDTSPDCTEGNLSETFSLYRAPTGYSIVGIEGPKRSTVDYLDDDLIEQWHLASCDLGVANIMAETRNDDLCDAGLNDRTRMTFTFAPVRLVIERPFTIE